MYGSLKQFTQNENKLMDFISSGKKGFFVIFLGIIKHWTVLVINQENLTKREFYYMDSNNIEFLNTEESKLYDICYKDEKELADLKGKKVKPAKVKIYSKVLSDTQKILEIIKKLFNNEINLRTFYIECETKLFMRDYEEFIEKIMFKEKARKLHVQEKIDYYYPKIKEFGEIIEKEENENLTTNIIHELYLWLIDHKPKFLKDGLFHDIEYLGSKHVSPKCKEILINWLEIQEKIMKKSEQYITETVVKFKKDDYNAPQKVLKDYQKLIRAYKFIFGIKKAEETK